MKMQFISDLHLEHRSSPLDYLTFVKPCAPILALLGDIGSPYEPKLCEFIAWCSQQFQHVFYVPGNHEYYTQVPVHTCELIHKELHTMCSAFPNVYILHNRTFTLENIMFIGSTLWSDIPPSKEAFMRTYMSDYKLIMAHPGTPITPAQTTQEYHINATFIRQSIEDARKKGLKAVVLTHHVPSFHETSAPQYKESDSCYGFASDFKCTNPSDIHVWCCGHTHYNFHHTLGGYELVSNQVGYGVRAIKGFDPQKFVEL